MDMDINIWIYGYGYIYGCKYIYMNKGIIYLKIKERARFNTPGQCLMKTRCSLNIYCVHELSEDGWLHRDSAEHIRAAWGFRKPSPKRRHGTGNSSCLLLESKLWYKWRAAAAKSLESCLTLCNPTDSSPPGSSVHGILQARILEC